MKQIKFFTTAIFFAIAFVGCGSGDSGSNLLDPNDPNNPNNPASGISKLEFTTTGTFHNGSFVIVTDNESFSVTAEGYLDVNDDMASVHFYDHNQRISFILFFPASKGTHQITEGSAEGSTARIKYFDNTPGQPEFHFETDNGTITITDLECRNLSVGGSQVQIMTRAKGTFNANLSGLNGEHTQNVSGTFYYVNNE